MVPFISLTDLSAYLKTEVDNTNLLAVAAIDSACAAIRTYTSQLLNLIRHDTITLHGNRHRDLLLPELPVLDVHSVQVDGTEMDDWFVGEAGILYRTDRRVWPAGIGNITVEYTHGWAVSEDDLEESGEPTAQRMPSDLRMCALRIAETVFRSNPGGIRQETIGSYSYTLAESVGGLIEPAMRPILDRYRIQGVG